MMLASPSPSEPTDQEESLLEKPYQPPVSKLRPLRTWIKFAVLQFILILCYTASVYIICRNFRQSSEFQSRLYSPAASAIGYETQTFARELNASSIYVASPAPEVDEAWEQLYKNAEIRVSAEDLRSINLNLQNHIRKYIYRAHYPQNFGFDDDEIHIAHCLDTLRQIVMCRGDTGLLTYEWHSKYRKPWPKFDVTHQCRNWDNIARWAEDHSVDTRGEILVHPDLGVVFPVADD
ncbi:hypothetical protein G7Y79_00015g038200 [Physcia stellaris]|nr:hypothetical protein G7Y79_00015g038200 [Physcia stellaris]